LHVTHVLFIKNFQSLNPQKTSEFTYEILHPSEICLKLNIQKVSWFCWQEQILLSRNKKKGTWETLRIWKKEKYEKKKIFPFFIYYICPVIHFFKNDFFHKIWIFWNRECSKVGFQFFSENSKKIQKKPCEKTKKMSKNPPLPKYDFFQKKKIWKFQNYYIF